MKTGSLFSWLRAAVVCAVVVGWAFNASAEISAGEAADQWTYDSSAKTITHSENGSVIKVTISGVNLTVASVTSLGEGVTELDLRPPVLSADGQTTYKIVGLGASAFANNKQLTKLYVPETLTTVKEAFASSSITSIEPFFPASVSSYGSRIFSNSSVAGDLKLCNPNMTVLGNSNEYFRDSPKLGSVDFTGSSIQKINSRACFYGNSSLTNVTFAKAFNEFVDKALVFGSCSNLRCMRFRGDPPAVSCLANPLSGTYLTFYLPKWNKQWESYLAAQTDCTVSEMVVSGKTDDFDTFATGHPGESLPVQKVKLGSGSTVMPTVPFVWWYPDAPPVNEPLTWFDVMGYDGVPGFAADGDEPLFDGTVYTRSTAQTAYCWTCADGHFAELTVPAAATTARGLKLTGYRLHQMSVGTTPNGRAPTAWTLSGRVLGSYEWTVIDTVEITAESPVHWAYFDADYSETVPARTACALEFAVPEAAQVCYSAFRFRPTNSRNKETGVADETPYGLMELELIGELASPEPTVTGFSQKGATWSSITFGATVSGLGDKPAEGRFSESATARVEVATDGEFADIVSVSPEMPITAKVELPLTVGSLAGNTDYYARLIVLNDLGYATTNVLADGASTLNSPWECENPTVTKRADGLDVGFSITALHATPATVTLAYRTTSAEDFRTIDSREVNAAGEFVFSTALPTDETFGSVQVTVSAGGVTRGYLIYVNEHWQVLPADAPTMVSNVVNGIAFSVTANDTNLSLASLLALQGQDLVDFRLPIAKPDGTACALVSVGTALKGDKSVREVRLPDTMTTLSASAFAGCYALEAVRLPSALTTVGASAFDNCIELRTVTPLLPETVTSIGASAFSGCKMLTADLFDIPDAITSIPDSFMSGCSKLTAVRLPSNLETIASSAFSGCSSITNFGPVFLPPTVRSVGSGAFLTVSKLPGELRLSNPNLTTIPNQSFREMAKITSIDMTGSGVTAINGQSCFYAMTSLTNIVFPVTLKSVGGDDITFGGCGALRHIRFLGGAPTCGNNDPFPSNGKYVFHVPGRGRHAASWRQYLADHPDWVREPTAAERSTYDEIYGKAAKKPKLMLNLGGRATFGFHYFRQPPPGLVMIVR